MPISYNLPHQSLSNLSLPADQRYKGSPSPSVQAYLSKITCVKPVVREHNIRDLVRLLDYQNNPDLKTFGIQVNTKQMLTVDGMSYTLMSELIFDAV